MKEIPILMNQASMTAYLAGRKHQTRRLVKLPSWLKRMKGDLSKAWVDGKGTGAEYLKVPCVKDPIGEPTVMSLMCPYGEPGDAVYFRETCFEHENGEIIYRADSDPVYHNWKWTPSIFMPKRLARFHVPLTKVRAERVQSISEADAIAEGINRVIAKVLDMERHEYSARYHFAELWDSIHGKKPEYKWSASPWVWVLEFPKYNAKETT